jgi:hypothetical protein
MDNKELLLDAGKNIALAIAALENCKPTDKQFVENIRLLVRELNSTRLSIKALVLEEPIQYAPSEGDAPPHAIL